MEDTKQDDGAGLSGSGVQRGVRPPLLERLRAPWHHADAREAADEIERLRALAEHLRHCRECAETDVANCPEGEPLWDACMPQPAAEIGGA